jgi:hypothetical protein
LVCPNAKGKALKEMDPVADFFYSCSGTISSMGDASVHSGGISYSPLLYVQASYMPTDDT